MTFDKIKTAAKMTKSMTTLPEAKCLICFEDSVATGDTLLQTAANANDDDHCTHFMCRVCFRFYLIQCENDRKKSAKCPDPDCAATIADAVMEDVLGRAYTPKVWHYNTQNNDQQQHQQQQQPDAELQAWLSANDAKKCKNCAAWIVREDGCDAMQCLCGWRFCWDCQAPIRANKDNDDDDDRCVCGWEVCDFYDNILGTEGRSTAPRLATLDDLQNMKALYERRQDEDCSSYASFDKSEMEYYAMDEEDDETTAVVEEECPVYLGSILDYEEPALGVFVGTILDWEAPEEEVKMEESEHEVEVLGETCGSVSDLEAAVSHLEAEINVGEAGDTDNLTATDAQDTATNTRVGNEEDDKAPSMASVSSKTPAMPLADQEPRSENGISVDASAETKSSLRRYYPLMVMTAPILWIASKCRKSGRPWSVK